MLSMLEFTINSCYSPPGDALLLAGSLLRLLLCQNLLVLQAPVPPGHRGGEGEGQGLGVVTTGSG